jgi:hypothetical protein
VRKDSFPTPNCLATAAAAAVSDGHSIWCSITRRTARAFSSGSIFFGVVLILLDSNRSGIKPGALQHDTIRGLHAGRCGHRSIPPTMKYLPSFPDRLGSL